MVSAEVRLVLMWKTKYGWCRCERPSMVGADVLMTPNGAGFSSLRICNLVFFQLHLFINESSPIVYANLVWIVLIHRIIPCVDEFYWSESNDMYFVWFYQVVWIIWIIESCNLNRMSCLDLIWIIPLVCELESFMSLPWGQFVLIVLCPVAWLRSK